MITAVLIDDETDSIRVLQRLLEMYCPDVKVAGIADGVETGLTAIRSLRPDLVFLDIEMTRGNAFDLLNSLQPIDFQVIFVTAFDSYAIKAIKYSAADYLLKPIAIADLRAAVDRAIHNIQVKAGTAQMETLLANIGNMQLSSQKMAIPTISGLVFITIGDIIRLEAKGSYTNIYLTSGSRFMSSRNIKEYEELLPAASFFRVHNSHIINLQKIREYVKGRGGQIIMEDGATVELANRRKELFLANFLK